MTTGKTVALIIWTFFWQRYTLSRFVIGFLPRRKPLLISWLLWPSAVILEPPKIKSVTVSMVPPPISMKWWDWMPWSSFSKCWVLSQLFTLLFHLHQEALWCVMLFMTHHKGGIICVSEVIDIFPVILIPAWASSSQAFWMMSGPCKLNKQGDNKQPWRTPFPIWNQSIVPCLLLTFASLPAYRFLRR